MTNKTPKKVREVWESKIKQQPSKNKHISYSQLSSFMTCQKSWYWTYVKNLAPYQPSIHATFGTALHETLQHWLEKVYHVSATKADEIDLDKVLYENLVSAYKAQKAQNSGKHFSNQNELSIFYLQGKSILNYIKKKRNYYFSKKKTHLAGIETLLYQELRPNVFFKGLIDLVFYDEAYDKWIIMDIKTSTSGWRDEVKKDIKKIAQTLLYKKFFSQQYDIPEEKIDIQYFIVKRVIPVDPDFPAQSRRVQEFSPPSGKIKIGQAMSAMNTFVETTLDENGNYFEKEYPTNPSKSNCRFCVFRDMKLCSDAVL
jgi:CRISPR/Cas system-associated exonuclease Cas4 (RecB family)